MPGVSIDGTDLSSIGCYVNEIDWMSGPDVSVEDVQIPAASGSYIGPYLTAAGRTLSISGIVIANSISTRLDAERRLKLLASKGLVTLSIDDGVQAMSLPGVVTSVAIEARGHPYLTVGSTFKLQFRSTDAYWYSTTSNVTVTTSFTAIPLGTAPTTGTLTIIATTATAVTDPVITYADSSNNTLASLTFTGVSIPQGASESLVVDLGYMTARRVSGSSSTNVLGNLTTSSRWFVLDPRHGDFSAGQWPKLRVTGSAGTPQGTLGYVKRWL